MMFEDKKNFMFDLYGTLVDIKTDEGLPSVWNTLANYYSLKGASYNDTDLKLSYGRICAAKTLELASKRGRGRHRLSETDVEIDLLSVFKELYNARGVDPSLKELNDTALVMRSASLLKLRLYDGAVKVLEELKSSGRRIYLLSNAQSCFTVPELKMLGICDYFDGIFISSQIGAKKPSQVFYDEALKGLKASECVMIGNDEFADIRGAMAAGMEACYIQTEQSPSFPVNLPSIRIDHLRDLL